MNTFAEFEEAYKRLVKINADIRIDSVLVQNKQDPESLDYLISFINMHLVFSKHMRFNMIFATIAGIIFLLLSFWLASQNNPITVYVMPIAILATIALMSSLSNFNDYRMSALMYLQQLRAHIDYYFKFADGLDKLDERLRQTATIRKPEDVQMIIDQEMNKIAIMANALIKTYGDIGARSNHDYVKLRASARQLRIIAKSLGYACKSFDDAIIANSINSSSNKKT